MIDLAYPRNWWRVCCWSLSTVVKMARTEILLRAFAARRMVKYPVELGTSALEVIDEEKFCLPYADFVLPGDWWYANGRVQCLGFRYSESHTTASGIKQPY